MAKGEEGEGARPCESDGLLMTIDVAESKGFSISSPTPYLHPHSVCVYAHVCICECVCVLNQILLCSPI